MNVVETAGVGPKDRILILARTRRERELICRVTHEAGLLCAPANSLDDLCAAVESGGAMAGVVAQEALAAGGFERLRGALDRQPAWSQLPLLIITPPGGFPASANVDPRRLGTATVLERPLRTATLASALQACQRLSRQQHDLRGAAEREKLLRQLQADRDLLELAQTAGNIGIFEWRVDERRLGVSPHLERMCGRSPGTFDGTPQAFSSILHPEDRERVLQTVNQIAGGTGDLDLEFRIVRPDASMQWLQARGRRLAGEPYRIAGVAIDITDRKRAEQERESLLDKLSGERTFLEQILDRMPAGVILAEAPSGRVFFQNRRVAEILTHKALEAESVADYSAWQPHRPDGTPFPVDQLPLARTVRAGEVVIGEEMKFPADGGWLHLRVSSGPIHDTAGKIVCGALVMDDITAWKEAEEALRKSEASLARAQRIAHLGDWERDIVTGELRWSDEVFRIFGFEPRAFVPSYEIFFDRVHPDDRRGVFEASARAIEQGEPYRVDHRIILPDGSVRTVAEYGEPVRDSGGRTIRLIGAVLDITDRKRAEDALRESEERFRAFMDNSPNTAWAKDEEGRYVYINATYRRRYHVRPEDFYGKTDYELWPVEAARQFVQNDADVLASGETISLFEKVPNPDGTVTDLWTFKFPFRDAAGKPYVGGMGIDITERQLMEERLRQALKMESVGRLAGGIAHDFNNLLAGILGFASLLRDEVPAASLQKVNLIADAAEKAADLTRQLLAYAGKGRFVIEAVNLSGLVREMAELMKASIPGNVAFELALDPRVPPVEADRGQIRLIVTNLVLNAAEAIGAGQAGAIVVRTRAQEVLGGNRPLDAVSGEPVPEGTYAVIEVRDTGCGMTPETQEKIFDPFFTTKFMGRGLGLAAVAGAVKTASGAIEVISSPEGGSTFRVLLPAAAGRMPVAATVAGENELRGTGTVLVVDDEKTVRDFARAALEKFGYRVLIAANGQDAVRLFELRPSDIDLVLLDLRLPVLNGEEAMEAMRAVRPDVKVILMSGYGEAEAARLFGRKRVVGFLRKPFTATRLAEQVKAVLRPA